MSEGVEAKLQPRLPFRVRLWGAGSALSVAELVVVSWAAGSHPISAVYLL